MDRRDFMALIPSISAIPIIGKLIEKDKDRIIIYQPEEVKAHLRVPPLNNIDIMKCKLQLVYDSSRVVGEGFLTEFNVEYEQLSMGDESLRGFSSVHVKGELYDFHLLNNRYG